MGGTSEQWAERSPFGPLQAVIMRHVATNVREAVVVGSGHWLMEERPVETVALLREFLDGPSPVKDGKVE